MLLDHHLQRGIVYRLVLSDGLRFSELKPDVLENKLFTYHLKKVVAAGYVAKNDAGMYTLTPEGRRLGMRVLDSQQALVDRAESVLFLVIRRKSDGAWLLYKRGAHPLRARVGFMHCTPTALADCAQIAQECCRDMTGLEGDFTALGGGYFRVYNGESLESFTHFTLMVCEDPAGQLAPHDEYADYFWVQKPDFSTAEMLPNMAILADLYHKRKPFFIEKTLQLTSN